MKNVPLGICSCCVAALVWIGSCGGIVAVLQNQLYFFKNESGLLAMQFGFLVSLGMALLGVVLAVVGMKQADQKPVFAVLGLVFNGLVLVGGVGVLCLSL